MFSARKSCTLISLSKNHWVIHITDALTTFLKSFHQASCGLHDKVKHGIAGITSGNLFLK